MRGEKFFNEVIRESGLDGTARKGRSTSLLQKRNECLVARYFYYGYLKHKCFEEILKLLVVEFYLSPSTVCRAVKDKGEQLQSLKQRGPTIHYFQSRWPHLKW